MSSQRRKWKFRVRHMMEAIERIQTYTSGKTKTGLKNDAMALDAVVWNLTVLGEAARSVPEEIVNAYPQLPWPQMRGIRNPIVHG